MDTVLINRRIATLDPAFPLVTALAIENGRFAAVGEDREILALRTPGTGDEPECPLADSCHRHDVPGHCSGNLLSISLRNRPHTRACTGIARRHCCRELPDFDVV